MNKLHVPFYRPITIIICFLFVAFLILFCIATGSAAKEKASAPAPSIETMQPKSKDDINKMLSRLSDEQVRQILIQQMEKTLPAANQSAQAAGQSGGMYRLESFTILFEQRVLELGRYLPQFFPDVATAIRQSFDGADLTVLLRVFLGLLVVIGLALAVERFCRRFSAGMRERFDAAPVMQGSQRFGTAMMRLLPDFLGIVVFTLTSALMYAVIPFAYKGSRLVLIAAMMAIVSIRLITLMFRLILSPHTAQLRLAPVSDATAAYLHRNFILLVGYFAGVRVILLFLQKLEVPMNGIFLITFALSIPFMGLLGRFIWQSRMLVTNHLRQRGQGPSVNISWFRNQMASGWHILAMGYVAIVWLVAIGRFLLYGPQNDQAFVISFLIVPFYLVSARAGKWLVIETLGTIRKTAEEEDSRYFTVAFGFVRAIILFTLMVWLSNIWGIDLPLLDKLGEAAFSIMMTLILAHVIWGQINRYVHQKLEALAPSAEEKVDDEEEMSGQTLDRSFTLLPVLRKFTGTMLMVMTILIVLSSMGINIAPLLAGASIFGLAIGFGSQKLVSDVLSGIFYLVDDSFRVGEYIQAGSVSGTVEGFSLRNVNLRHDKGALQIVPFSKLGAVTNFNRGGAVVKFKLSLPYDTSISQVRKIIKKVGQQLMEDPELGPDILLPVKSMGVQTVADSVMTFRVRFTARFGRQGIIQRKAFEMITDALAKKGIHYAHRKVIVEIPPGHEKASGGAKPAGADPSPEAADHLTAGAAAALSLMLADEAQKNEALAKKKESSQ
jgi:small-conductance mechanosensitive channel